MNVIITGGTGLIGSALAEMLLADGHAVTVLSRSPQAKADQVPDGAQIAGWDAETGDGWVEHVNAADAIVNLAGASIAGDGFPPQRWTSARKELILQSRLKAGQAVVDAVERADNKPGVLIQSSAVGYYGVRGDEVVLESDPAGEDFLADVCVQWEASTAPVEALGVRRCVIRTGLVLSTEGGAFPLIALPFKLMVGGPMGSGRQYYPWIHIDDELRAIRFLLTNEDASGVYNLTAPEPVPNREFAKTLGDVMNRPAFFPTPGFALKLALGEMSTVVLDGQRAVPERLREAGFEWTYDSLEPALRDLLEG